MHFSHGMRSSYGISYGIRSLTLALVLGAALGSAVQAATVKIALGGPLSGPIALYGEELKQGMLTAIEEVNAQGGADGNRLELVEKDEACDPKQAVTVANQIVSEKIRFVVGHVCSGATKSVTGIYQNEGIVMITPSSTAPDVTEGKRYTTIFRTIGRDDQQAPTAAEYIIRKVKPQKVAVLHDKQSYGQGIAMLVKRDLDKAKIPVVIFEGVNAGDSDYSAVVTKMQREKVDFVYFGGYHPELGLLLKQSREQGFKAIYMGPEGAGNKDISAIAGAASEGLLVSLPADFSKLPGNAALVKTFQEKGRDASGTFQIPAYTAVKVIVEAITKTKSIDSRKVAAYLHAHSFNTPLGHNTVFDPQGDLKAFRFEIFTWHADASKTPAP